jgi:hypothetical protein
MGWHRRANPTHLWPGQADSAAAPAGPAGWSARGFPARSERSPSSRRALRAASAPGAFIASHIAANRRWSRILSPPTRSADPRRRCTISSLLAIPSPPCPNQKGGGWNRPTTPPLARTSHRQISTVSRIPASESTNACSSAMVCSRLRAGNMPVFISLWLCGPKGSVLKTTRSRGQAAAVLASAPSGQRPGLSIRIVAPEGASAGASPGRAETARPVQDSNRSSPVLAGI